MNPYMWRGRDRGGVVSALWDLWESAEYADGLYGPRRRASTHERALDEELSCRLGHFEGDGTRLLRGVQFDDVVRR